MCLWLTNWGEKQVCLSFWRLNLFKSEKFPRLVCLRVCLVCKETIIREWVCSSLFFKFARNTRRLWERWIFFNADDAAAVYIHSLDVRERPTRALSENFVRSRSKNFVRRMVSNAMLRVFLHGNAKYNAILETTRRPYYRLKIWIKHTHTHRRYVEAWLPPFCDHLHSLPLCM